MMTIMITIMITMILAIPFLLSTSVIALLIAVKVKYGLESPSIVALVFRVSVINFTFEIYIAVDDTFHFQWCMYSWSHPGPNHHPPVRPDRKVHTSSRLLFL